MRNLQLLADLNIELSEHLDLIDLAELKFGEVGLIVKILTGNNKYYRQRLLAQGLVPGEKITIKHIAPFGDPIELGLAASGRNIIIRKQEVNIIKVRKIKQAK